MGSYNEGHLETGSDAADYFQPVTVEDGEADKWTTYVGQFNRLYVCVGLGWGSKNEGHSGTGSVAADFQFSQ